MHLVLRFHADTFTDRQILKNIFRRCKPAREERIVGFVKGIKVKGRERGLVVERGSCRRRGHKQSMDEKRARFTTKKGQEYGSTTESIHMCILCKFKFQH